MNDEKGNGPGGLEQAGSLSGKAGKRIKSLAQCIYPFKRKNIEDLGDRRGAGKYMQYAGKGSSGDQRQYQGADW